MKVASRLDAIVATLVGVLALAVSGYTAYIQKQQVRAQVWPYIAIGYSTDPMRFMVSNKGVGPAIIKYVVVTVDGQPVTHWDEVLDRVAQRHESSYSSIHRRVVAPSEEINVLVPHDEKGKDISGSDPAGSYGDLLKRALERIDLKICYCSTLGDCWTTDDSGTVPTAHCPTPSATSFQE